MKRIPTRVGLIFLTGFFWICDSPSIPEENPSPQIGNVLFEYNQDSLSIWIQADVNDPQGAENIDSVWVELETLSESEPLYHFLLEDDGVNGDILAGNSIFSADAVIPGGIPFAVYRIHTYALDTDDHLGESPGIISIEEQFPPQIQSIDMPSSFYLDPAGWGTLTIRANIFDPNGADDISYVRYAINTDFLTLDCDGNYNSNPDPDHYQWDPSWVMNYQSTDENGFLVFQTDIPMRPADDGTGICGKTGLALFQFSVRDKSGQTDIMTEYPLEIIKCGDGFCQDSWEDNTTCPEDCP